MAKIDGDGASSATDLQDDTVKLVAYTIVSLKRDKEKIMPGGKDSVIVTDNMTGEAFESKILAEYLTKLVPDPDNDQKKFRPRDKIDPGDLKYLRVYYVVSHRWPRESLKFEEREIDVMKGIRDRLA